VTEHDAPIPSRPLSIAARGRAHRWPHGEGHSRSTISDRPEYVFSNSRSSAGLAEIPGRRARVQGRPVAAEVADRKLRSASQPVRINAGELARLRQHGAQGRPARSIRPFWLHRGAGGRAASARCAGIADDGAQQRRPSRWRRAPTRAAMCDSMSRRQRGAGRAMAGRPFSAASAHDGINARQQAPGRLRQSRGEALCHVASVRLSVWPSGQ